MTPFKWVEKVSLFLPSILNAMAAKSKTAHRLPFVLDAILKEDIDETSLDSILTFVGKNLPDDTQTFISISEHVKYDSRIFAETMHSCFKAICAARIWTARSGNL